MAQDVKPIPLGLKHLAFVVVATCLVAAGWFIFYSPGWTGPVADGAPTVVGIDETD